MNFITKEDENKIGRAIMPILRKVEAEANKFLKRKPYYTYTEYIMLSSDVREVVISRIEPKKLNNSTLIKNKKEIYEQVDFKVDLNEFDLFLKLILITSKHFSNCNIDFLRDVATAKDGDRINVVHELGYGGIVGSESLTFPSMKSYNETFKTYEEALLFVENKFKGEKVEIRKREENR